ncbi:MAG: helix-turn-helix domain-containing protein [Steroidobacteraceae bacterium]
MASADYNGVAGLQAYRRASAESCAISVRDDPGRFRAQCRVHHLGSAVLADLRSSSLRYIRSARQVARGAVDHYQITFNLTGEIHYRSGRQSVIVRDGEVVILDSAREIDAYIHAPDQGLARVLTLFVPRAALTPLLRLPGGGHLLFLSGEQALAQSAHAHLSKMLETIELEPLAAPQAAVQALTGLLAGSLGGQRNRPPTALRAGHRSAADSLERLIERRLDSPALSIGLLCSYCGCSRATVYRLLEANGGPMRYIRQRRLQRAFHDLISNGASERPLLELALRHRFASEATFNRAFHRTFGMPPGEVREIAARSRRAAPADGRTPGSSLDDGTQVIEWIRTLGT